MWVTYMVKQATLKMVAIASSAAENFSAPDIEAFHGSVMLSPVSCHVETLQTSYIVVASTSLR